MARGFAARFSLQSSSPASNWDGDWTNQDIPRPSTLDEAKLYGCCYSSMLLSNSAIRHPWLELLQCSQVDSQTIFWSLRADKTATFLLKNPQMISYYVAFYLYFKFTKTSDVYVESTSLESRMFRNKNCFRSTIWTFGLSRSIQVSNSCVPWGFGDVPRTGAAGSVGRPRSVCHTARVMALHGVG